MLRALFWLIVVVALAVVCTTVKFGDRTLYGHFMAIWHTKEAQDAKKGIEQKAGPAVDKLERAGKKAYDELRKDDAPGSGSASGSGVAAPTPPAAGPAPAPKW